MKVNGNALQITKRSTRNPHKIRDSLKKVPKLFFNLKKVASQKKSTLNLNIGNNYGTLLKKLGRLQEAEEHYGPSRGGPHKRALALGSGDTRLCDNLLMIRQCFL